MAVRRPPPGRGRRPASTPRSSPPPGCPRISHPLIVALPLPLAALWWRRGGRREDVLGAARAAVPGPLRARPLEHPLLPPAAGAGPAGLGGRARARAARLSLVTVGAVWLSLLPARLALRHGPVRALPGLGAAARRLPRLVAVRRTATLGAPMARRTDQRRAAVFALYQHDLTGRPLDDLFERGAADVHPRAGPRHGRQRRGARPADRAPRDGLEPEPHRAAGAGDPAHRAAGDAPSRPRRGRAPDPARGRDRRGGRDREGVLRRRRARLRQRRARRRAARARAATPSAEPSQPRSDPKRNER